MANALAAVTALEAAGTSLQQDELGIHLEITRGLNELSAVRGVDTVVSHRTGRVAGSRVADVREIELSGYVLGIGDTGTEQRASFRSLIGTLQGLFDPTLAPWELSCTLEDGSAATINVRCVDLLVTEQIRSLVAAVKVALESIDPGWVVTPPPEP